MLWGAKLGAEVSPVHPPEIEGAAADLQRLSARVAALEARVQLLERSARPVAAREAPVAASTESTGAETAALAGRMALGLGGAFVFRSATQAGLLTPGLGVLLGLLYGLAWLVAADRAAIRGRLRPAVGDAVTAALIGFPLVWEATARFHFLNLLQAWTAAAVLASGYLIVALRRRMPDLLWPVVAGLPPLCLALALATNVFPVWLALLLAGATTLQVLAARRGRFRLVGTTALVLFDLALVLVTGLACIATPLVLEHALVPWQVLALQTAAFVLGAGLLLVRSARRGRVHRREAWQAAVVTLVGLGGALLVGLRTGASTLAAGAAAALLGLAACALALRMARPAALGLPGLAVLVTGLAMLLRGVPLLVALCTLAVGAALAAVAWRESVGGAWLGLQAAVTGGVVLALSGALSFGLGALAGGETPIPWSTTALSLLAGLTCAAVLPAGGGRGLALARSALVGGVVVVGGGLAAAALGPLLPPILRPSLRTALIAGAALALARTTPALVTPLLIAGGIKILLDEVRGGNPTVLVLSFSLYGLALLLAARLLRRARPA